MAEKLPVVCVFGIDTIHLQSSDIFPMFETGNLDCRCYPTDENLSAILACDRPNVIVSFGLAENYPNLMLAPFSIRKRWLNFSSFDDAIRIGSDAFNCYIQNAIRERKEYPLVSVFTPAFRTGEKIRRPLWSLLAQTYKDWEWIIVDDSNDDGETFKELCKLTDEDCRIRVYRSRHSGVIGKVKKDACLLARGEYLVELDHDDELTPDALLKVVVAYDNFPDVGFVYTDFTECFEDATPAVYGNGWGFGYGSYRDETINGVSYKVVNSPNINAKTIRHIVAAPNHIRSWRKKTYLEIGGHGDDIHVADDYELMVRTFLNTRMARIPSMCYLQYRNQEGNTHRERNQEIQRLVRYFSMVYDRQIHDRLLALGVDDFVWKEGEPSFYRLNVVPNPPVESHCTVLANV